MWTRELAERYNIARQACVEAREEVERLLAEDHDVSSPEVQEAQQRDERAYADMEAINTLAEGQQDIPAAIDASQWEGADQARRPNAAVQRALSPWFADIRTGDGLPPLQTFQREADNADYRLAFDAYTRRLSVRGARQHYMEAAQNVLQVGVDPQGGLLVPPDQIAGIFSRMAAAAPFTEQVASRNTSRDRVQITTIRPHATDFDIYSSNFVGAWVDEIPAATAGEAEPTFGLLTIPVRKARTKTFITHDELADPDLDVVDLLRENGGENLGLLVEKALLVGTGVGEPRGIFNSPTGANPAKNAVTAGGVDQTPLVSVEGSTADTISSTTTDQASVKAIIRIPYQLPSQYLAGSRWVMHRLTEKSVRQLIDGNGSYIWAPGFAEMPNTLLGFPITRSDFVAVEADAAKVLAFGNFAVAYQKVQRMLLAAQVDPFSKTDVEQVVLYLRIRVGGDVVNPRAFVIGSIATT